MSISFAIPGLMNPPPVISAVDIDRYLTDAEVGTYNPPPMFKGDTWVGIPELTMKIDGHAPASPLAAVRVEFFKQNYDSGFTPDTGCQLLSPADVTILDAEGWGISIPPVKLPLNRGEWRFRVVYTDSDSVDKTRVIGLLPIL